MRRGALPGVRKVSLGDGLRLSLVADLYVCGHACVSSVPVELMSSHATPAAPAQPTLHAPKKEMHVRHS